MKKTDSACRAIKAAATESEVLAAVRGYLSSLNATELSVLPASITTLVLNGAEETVHAALSLVHGAMKLAGEPAETAQLNDLTLVLTSAAKRLAALAKDTA